ncbi:MAG: hypothetical protein KC457_14225, partial [Myxococcales bacterium]|nr:hypothetical protein [Myxococcales bacterium]
MSGTVGGFGIEPSCSGQTKGVVPHLTRFAISCERRTIRESSRGFGPSFEVDNHGFRRLDARSDQLSAGKDRDVRARPGYEKGEGGAGSTAAQEYRRLGRIAPCTTFATSMGEAPAQA